MAANLPVTGAKLKPLTACAASSMRQPELTERHRLSVGTTVVTMMKAGAYYDKGEAEVMETAMLRDWIDRLQDWTTDAIRKAFWVWQDNNPNRRPSPAHILHILRDTYGRSVVAERQAQPQQIEPPKEPRVTPERAAAIMAEIGLRFPTSRDPKAHEGGVNGIGL